MLWKSIRSVAALVAIAIVACLYTPVHAVDDSLSRAQKDGIRVAFYGEEPYAFLDSSNQYAGVEADLIKAVAKRLSIPQVIPVQTAWESLVPGLLAGRYDTITAGIIMNNARSEVATPG